MKISETASDGLACHWLHNSPYSSAQHKHVKEFPYDCSDFHYDEAEGEIKTTESPYNVS